MSVIKSFSVSDINGEQGDMFYIKHDSSNFTIIDCCLDDNDKKGECKIVCVNRYCMNLLYAPYWGKQR